MISMCRGCPGFRLAPEPATFGSFLYTDMWRSQLAWCHPVVHYQRSHASCTRPRVPRKLCTISGSTQVVHDLGPHANWVVGSTYRKLWNVVGSGARRELGQFRHIEIISFLQFGNGWSTVDSTYRCIGKSRMWLARAPDGRRAIAVA